MYGLPHSRVARLHETARAAWSGGFEGQPAQGGVKPAEPLDGLRGHRVTARARAGLGRASPSQVYSNAAVCSLYVDWRRPTESVCRPMPFTDRLCLVQQLDYHTPLSEIIMILIVTIGFGNSADKLRMPRSPAYSAAELAADSLHAELVCTITSDLCSAICSGSEAVTTRVRGGILRYVFLLLGGYSGWRYMASYLLGWLQLSLTGFCAHSWSFRSGMTMRSVDYQPRI